MASTAFLRTFKHFIAFSLSIAACAAFCSAQDTGKRGRLPDGRAYRVDPNGFQLVDHIAELEVGVEDLQKQVATLELELEERDRRLQAAGGTAPAGDKSVPNCNELVSELYLKNSRLQSQLKDPALPAARQACNYESPENPLWNKVNLLEQELGKRTETEKQLVQQVKSSTCDYQSEANPLWSQVRDLQTRLSEETRAREASASDLQAVKETGAEAKQPEIVPANQVAMNPRGRLAPPVQPDAAINTQVAPGIVDTGDVAAARRDLRKTLQNIEQLILTRKSDYDRLKDSNKSGVTVKISALRTANGLSLDVLRSKTAKLSQASEVPGIRSGLNEIQKILEDDIRLVRRLSNLQ